MTNKNEDLSSQKRAEIKRSEKRKGTPTFSSVRFKDIKSKMKIDDIISKHKGSREEVLIAAFDALEEKLKNP
jgi:hypothetical protein